jgi:hypothetical protein
MGAMGGRTLIQDPSRPLRNKTMRITSSPALWITVALAVGVLLMLMFWDYLWVNFIHSGTIDAP